MKRQALTYAWMALALLTASCTLTDMPPTPVPTAQQPPVLANPVVGLNPVSGAPGTVVQVSVAGFPAGSRINIYILVNQASAGSATPTPSSSSPGPVMQGLTINTGGFLTFPYQLPTQINGVNLTADMPLNFLASTVDVPPMQSSAVFIVTAGGGTNATNAPSASGDQGAQLYIISPDINAVVAGGSVVVTGSGSAYNNRVGVQVQNGQNGIMGSSLATIQAGTGAVGVWQTTVAFPQPATTMGGFIVAYTVNSAGAVASNASIPITFAGSGVPTSTAVGLPTATPLIPTVPPIITAIPPASSIPFITATSSQ